jgi:hypothetical protein
MSDTAGDKKAPAKKEEEPLKPAWQGRDHLPNLPNPPDLLDLGTRELRFNTTAVIVAVGQGDWLRISHYGTKIGCIIRVDDLDFLVNLCNSANVDDVIAALVEWKRCGPTAKLVGALNALKAEAKAGGNVGYVRRLGDFEQCKPSPSTDSNPSSVEFADAVIPFGQFATAGSADGKMFVHGFMERADPGAKFLLELPNGETIAEFGEDGATLNLKRTPLSSAISLYDIRVRRL